MTLTITDNLSPPLDWRAYRSLKQHKTKQWLRAQTQISRVRNTGRIQPIRFIAASIWSELDRVVYQSEFRIWSITKIPSAFHAGCTLSCWEREKWASKTPQAFEIKYMAPAYPRWLRSKIYIAVIYKCRFGGWCCIQLNIPGPYSGDRMATATVSDKRR